MKAYRYGWCTLLLLLLPVGLLSCSNTRVDPTPTPEVPAQLAVVVGQVTDPDGTPIAAAEIEQQPLTPNLAATGMVFLTNEVGEYRLDLEPGQYEITVRADGYRSRTREVTAPGGTVTTVHVVLEPES